jgi:CubicO group peptidase (beta-lactamase class C family)
VIGWLFATLFMTPAAQAAAPRAEFGRALDAFTAPLEKSGHLSGQLLVARQGRVILERNYGWANAELKVPVTPETRFNIASVTKPMTVTLAIQLMAERALGYNDTLAKWIPDFPRGNEITIAQLLRHRSGIPHRVTTTAEEVRPMTAGDVVEAAKRVPLKFPPGSQMSYSSGGFSVLARVLELAGGKDYATLLQERICGPLGMTHTLHTDSRHLLPGRAASYEPAAEGVERAPLQDLSFLVGAGSVWSTARDLHLFVQGLVTGKLGPGPQQSLVRGGRLSMNGYTDGFIAWADWDSASGVEAVFVGNVHSGASDQVRRALPKLVAGEAVPPPALPALASGAAAPPDSVLARAEGIYLLGNGTRLHLRRRDGVLRANGWALLPAAAGGFFSPQDYGMVQTVPGPDGRAARLDWSVGGQTWPAPRVGELSANPEDDEADP